VEDSPLARAKAKALRLLAARPRTAPEVRERLERAGFGPEVSAVIEWLSGLGYLDDEAYARDRARRLVAPGGMGPRLAEARLTAAGIPLALARRAVSEALAAGGEGTAMSGEAERCRLLAARRASGPVAELDDRERSRLARFLLGRGFSGAAVSAALGVLVDDEGGR
jgi:regulatory protein